jgi:hypothetical protein
MKTKVLLLIILLFCIFSCEKSDFKHSLLGKWKIFGSSGGIHGQGANYDFEYMYIDRGDDYRFSRNDTIIERGSFNLVDYNNTSSRGDYLIEFSPKNRIGIGAEQITAQPMIIQIISNDSIILLDGMIDGFGYYFAKQ